MTPHPTNVATLKHAFHHRQHRRSNGPQPACQLPGMIRQQQIDNACACGVHARREATFCSPASGGLGLSSLHRYLVEGSSSRYSILWFDWRCLRSGRSTSSYTLQRKVFLLGGVDALGTCRLLAGFTARGVAFARWLSMLKVSPYHGSALP